MEAAHNARESVKHAEWASPESPFLARELAWLYAESRQITFALLDWLERTDVPLEYEADEFYWGLRNDKARVWDYIAQYWAPRQSEDPRGGNLPLPASTALDARHRATCARRAQGIRPPKAKAFVMDAGELTDEIQPHYASYIPYDIFMSGYDELPCSASTNGFLLDETQVVLQDIERRVLRSTHWGRRRTVYDALQGIEVPHYIQVGIFTDERVREVRGRSDPRVRHCPLSVEEIMGDWSPERLTNPAQAQHAPNP